MRSDIDIFAAVTYLPVIILVVLISYNACFVVVVWIKLSALGLTDRALRLSDTGCCSVTGSEVELFIAIGVGTCVPVLTVFVAPFSNCNVLGSIGSTEAGVTGSADSGSSTGCVGSVLSDCTVFG